VDSKKPNKSILLIIDALRLDALSNSKARKLMFPNLDYLIKNGALGDAISNAQSTQFVMPSIFCLNYPLDYEGYATGILNRPVSYIELLNKHKYETQLISSCNQLGVSNGYDRGFNKIKSTVDYRVILEQRITRNLSYYLENLNTKDNKKNLIIDYKSLLTGLIKSIELSDTSVWSNKLKYFNNMIALSAKKEIDLLSKNENLVIERLRNVPAGVYWYVLGRKSIPRFVYLYRRAREGVLWRLRKFISNKTKFPFLIYSHWVSYASEVFDVLISELKLSKSCNQHFHIHVMDVHDCRSINRLYYKLKQLKYLPKWIFSKLTGLTSRHYLYDLALMSVDGQIGKTIKTLKDYNLLDSSSIVVSGDHGLRFAQSPRKYNKVGFRTHYEDINIPIVAYNQGKHLANTRNMSDSMSIVATLFDLLKINMDDSFKGSSIFSSSENEYVIVESCGDRFPNLLESDIYFTVVADRYKLMTMLKGKKLHFNALYDIHNDKFELDNIINTDNCKSIVNKLVKLLFLERRELFLSRGVLDLSLLSDNSS